MGERGVITRPLRVLHVTTDSRIGGAERLIVALARATPPSLATVEVATLRPPGELTAALAAQGTMCHSLRIRHAAEMPLAEARLIALVARRGYDVIHGHLVHGGAAAMSAGLIARVPVRVITRHHSTVVWKYGSRVDRIIEVVANTLAQRVIAVGGAVRTVLVEREGVDPRKVVVIRNGIDVAAVHAAGVPRRVRRSVGLVIGTVAALYPYKGHHTAFEALRTLLSAGHETRYELVGEGPQRSELQRFARALGIADAITFLGFVADPFPVVKSWDVYLQPSIEEGLSMAVLEAMALARPVVCSRSGEMNEVIRHDEDGLLVAPGDVAAIVEAVGRLARDREWARCLGESARARVGREFDITTVARAYVDAYRDLLPRGVPPH